MATAKRTRKSKSPQVTAAPVHKVALSPDLQEAIRSRAYSIYEQRGREHGHDIDDWLMRRSRSCWQGLRSVSIKQLLARAIGAELRVLLSKCREGAEDGIHPSGRVEQNTPRRRA